MLAVSFCWFIFHCIIMVVSIENVDIVESLRLVWRPICIKLLVDWFRFVQRMTVLQQSSFFIHFNIRQRDRI